MARGGKARYAVETTNEKGTVRFMETDQDWVAQAFADRANAAFELAGVSSRAVAVKTDVKLKEATNE